MFIPSFTCAHHADPAVAAKDTDYCYLCELIEDAATFLRKYKHFKPDSPVFYAVTALYEYCERHPDLDFDEVVRAVKAERQRHAEEWGRRQRHTEEWDRRHSRSTLAV